MRCDVKTASEVGRAALARPLCLEGCRALLRPWTGTPPTCVYVANEQNPDAQREHTAERA
ncbi:hypothetical protein FB157_107127 [Streptomyces sp. BK340]|nr:hypothetical protein FB157_107127 [Streptomyces sp. BK340]